MCGIFGLATIGRSPDDLEIVRKSMERVRHRGPDDSSIVSIGCDGPRITLGHARLAVIGGANAIQPLEWKKERSLFYLVVNGEIYNYQELREELVEAALCKPDEFKTNGDSEVLMACLVHQGLEWTLKNIVGMYAFVLVESTACNGKIDSITMCRDAFGIKPLCFGIDHQHKTLVISSEMAAIPESFHYVHVKDVLPSTYVKVECCIECDTLRWSMTETAYRRELELKSFDSQKNIEENIPTKLIRQRLIDAVTVRIPKDGVKWGVLLSGGLDSSLIASIAADIVYPSPLYTFTITYSPDDQGVVHVADSDMCHARIVANSRPNIIHDEVTFSFQDGLDVLSSVVSSVETMDVAVVRASVPLYLLSRYISSKNFKVVLCGEGADETFAGYRLFEDYLPSSNDDCKKFANELERRLFQIDTSELQRVDRCTSAHGLEARVPFMDVSFVETVLGIDHKEIQKYILRSAFDGYLPDSVVYREKEQFADGIGPSWVAKLQAHATEAFPQNEAKEESEATLYKTLLQFPPKSKQQLPFEIRELLIEERKARRRKNTDGKISRPGSSQPFRWHKVRHDVDLQKINLTLDDAHHFLRNVLGWSSNAIKSLSHNLESLNNLIVSMLSRVPFHNLTLLTRERRPPTMTEIKDDMMKGLGGPCSVVNAFFSILLDKLGFGPHIYLLSCRINGRNDCHVAILLQMKGLRYFVDVANAKPYTRAVHLGDTTVNACLNGSFRWRLAYSSESNMMQVRHIIGTEETVAVEFHPASTVQYNSFYDMIRKSRSEVSFGPFLTGLRLCLFPKDATEIVAVRDACIYDGNSMNCKRCASCRHDLLKIAKRDAFDHMEGFDELVKNAIDVLDREHPEWLDASPYPSSTALQMSDSGGVGMGVPVCKDNSERIGSSVITKDRESTESQMEEDVFHEEQ
ncbi:hypothetical protein HJC23_004738 [Cyclotella cryptica]|uniref:Glutamine amidotransferase type-2 domain-containing protein n=1 Tax=Cyclotella cryptica TaxID=29204 RepID=A0ABD3NWN0_9STRA